MTTQEFSVPYRAPGIVDTLIPRVAGRTGYRLKASPQFDGTPAFVQLFEMASNHGYLDPAVDRRKLHTMPGQQHIRAVFNPNTFATGQPVAAAITDTMQFWMRFQPVDSGVAGADSDPVLILTPSQHNGQGRIVIAGDAPNAANVAGSLTLCLSRRMKNFTIRNHSGSNALFVAFNSEGPETQVASNTSWTFFGGAESTLVVRGGGATVNFSADFTAATNL